MNDKTPNPIEPNRTPTSSSKPAVTTEAERWLAAIVESSDDAIIGESLDGIITSWNAGATRIFGYSAEEAIGNSVSWFAWPGEEGHIEGLLSRLKCGERVDHFETIRRHQTGRKVFVSLGLSPIRDVNGVIVGIAKIARDISERRLATEMLKNQALLLDQAHEAIVIRDEQDRIIYWNRGAERLYGWTSEDALGQISHDLLHTIFPEPLASIQHRLRTAGHWEGELIHTTRNAQTLTMLSHWVLSCGSPTGLVLETNFDLTEQKKMISREEHARAEIHAERRFHDLIEHAPDTILQVDTAGRIVIANSTAQSMFGYTHEELLASGVDLLVPEAHRAAHPGRRKAFAAAGIARPMGHGLDLQARRKDGTEFPVEISLSPVKTEQGVYVTAVVRDVTERKRVEAQVRVLEKNYLQELEARKEEAERLNRLKSEFLASISHELRTPLHTIIGFSELLAEESEGPLNEEQRRFLEHIHRDSEHLLALINDVLDFSQIEAGGLNLHAEVLPLSEVISEAANAIRPSAGAKGISMLTDADGQIRVLADRLRLRQVFYNLLNNAVKFTSRSGTISVNATPVPNEQSVQITVSDTGIGIADEERAQIFDKFYQVGVTSDGVREGTGLGLAICKQLVEMHGGRIWVESEPGRGSQFHFTLRTP
jgi:PAS domain S-box-containing protein